MPRGVYKHGTPANKIAEQNKLRFPCRICGKVVLMLPGQARQRQPKYCGLICARIGHRGYKHSDEAKKKIKASQPRLGTGLDVNFVSSVRRSLKYKQWRLDVLKRDGFTCQICGAKPGKLHVDHLQSFSLLLKKYGITTFEDAARCQELWQMNNARTLCIPCHWGTDNYGSKAIAQTA